MEKSNYIVAFGDHQGCTEWIMLQDCLLQTARNEMLGMLLKKITTWVDYQQKGTLKIDYIWENKYGYSVRIKEEVKDKMDVYIFKCFDEMDIYKGEPDGVDMMHWIWGKKDTGCEVYE